MLVHPWVSPIRGFRPRLFKFNPCRAAGYSLLFIRGFSPSVGFAHPWVSPTVIQIQPLQGCGKFHLVRSSVGFTCPWVSPVRGFRPRLFKFNPCRVAGNSLLFVRRWVSPIRGFRPRLFMFNPFGVSMFLHILYFCYSIFFVYAHSRNFLQVS